MSPSLRIDRGSMAHLDDYYYHQLIPFNAAHQITTLLLVISTLSFNATSVFFSISNSIAFW